MSNSTLNKTILSTLAAAVVATTFSITPSVAGGGGGGGWDRTYSTISTRNTDGSTTSIRSRNGAKSYTITKRNKNGKVTKKTRVKKKRPTFVTIHNPDGTSRTITQTTRSRVSWASSTDPNTGVTRMSGRASNGGRFSITISPFGVGIGFGN